MSATILYSPSFRHGSSCDGGAGFGGSLAIGSDQGVLRLCCHLSPLEHPNLGADYRESYNFIKSKKIWRDPGYSVHSSSQQCRGGGGPLEQWQLLRFYPP